MGVWFGRVRGACVGFTCHHPSPFTPHHHNQGGFGVLNQVLDSTIFEGMPTKYMVGASINPMNREQLFHCKVS